MQLSYDHHVRQPIYRRTTCISSELEPNACHSAINAFLGRGTATLHLFPPLPHEERVSESPRQKRSVCASLFSFPGHIQFMPSANATMAFQRGFKGVVFLFSLSIFVMPSGASDVCNIIVRHLISRKNKALIFCFFDPAFKRDHA